MGLPSHLSHEEDVVELEPGNPYELAFDLQPNSNAFNAGNRIRITITCADKDSALTYELSSPPTATVYRNKERPFYIRLPVIVPQEEGGEKTKSEFSLFAIGFIGIFVIILVIAFTTFIRKRMKP